MIDETIIMDNYKQQFFEYSSLHKSISTVRGYLSSLKEDSVVGDILYSINTNRNIFEVTDLETLNRVYKKILDADANRKSHARFSAAVNSYIVFVKQIKKVE